MNIYISSAIKENITDVVAVANEFDVNIEVCRFYDPALLDGNLKEKVNKFSNALKNLKGKVSIHGPFMDMNPVAKDQKIAEISIHRYNQAFEVAKTLNTHTIVFHTGYNSLIKSQIYHDKFIEDSIIFWQSFIKKFEDSNITVVLENTYENTPEVITSIINTVNSEHLKACIDTGHVNINSSLSILEWIDTYGKNLHHMHLHNNFGTCDDHNSLLSGTLDFGEILAHLGKNNLHPNVVVEVFKEQPSLESVEFIKKQLSLIRSK